MTPDLAGADVAVVIVNYRTPELTERCLAALRGERDLLPQLQAVVVDGGSDDGSAEELRRTVAKPQYKNWVSFLPLPINGGFGWANNQAILTLAQETRPPEYIHLLNPDAEICGGAVAHLVEELNEHPNCGAVGSQLLAPEGRAVPSAFRFPSAGRELVNAAQSETLGRLLGVGAAAIQADTSTEVDWVTGASVMFRSAALRETGLFDDGFFLYFEEVELMHRLRERDWTVRQVPRSQVAHIEGASTGVGPASPPGLPRYWYQSRRRYFALTGGRAGTLAANLAWLSGRAVAVLKKALGRGAPSPVRTGDLLRGGIWPNRKDLHPSVCAWGDAPGKPPAWMHVQ
jgi:hypothetical protein